MCQNGQTHFENLFRVWLTILGQKPSFLMISIEEKLIRLDTIISYCIRSSQMIHKTS